MHGHDGYMSLRYYRRKLASLTTLIDGETLSRLKGPAVINLGGRSCPEVGWSLVHGDSLSTGPLSVSVLASEPNRNGTSANLLRPYGLVCRMNPDL